MVSRVIGIVAALALAALAAAPAHAVAPEPSPTPTVEHDPARPHIMFIGDSITGSPGCWRATVWTTLADAGYVFHAVGPRKEDECGGVTAADGRVWEPANAGYSGRTTYFMTSKIAVDGLLVKNQPDVIVLLLGTNDIWGGLDPDILMSQYDFLLAQMRDYDPNISLVIGTILPMAPSQCGDCQAVIDKVNPRIVAWAAAVSTPESPVRVAALHEGFDVDADTWEGVHPNPAGDAKIAAAFTPVIEAALDDYFARPDHGEGLPWWAVVFGAPLLIASASLLARAGARRRAADASE